MKNALFVLLLSFWVCGTCVADDKKSFAGKDLTGKDFSGAVLNGADFTDATINEVKFTGASLKNANFKDSLMKTAIFRRADMTGANMSGLKAPGGVFERTNLTKTIWDGSVLPGASSCNFQEADLRKAKIGPYFFNTCDFRRADLRGANLLAPAKYGFNHCMWKGAIYNEDTAFPEHFDPKEEGMILDKPADKKGDKE